MKKVLLAFSFITLTYFSQAQNNVGIGTSTPNSEAILELFSTDKGLLLPRLNAGDTATNFTSPTEGMMFFAQDIDRLMYYDGSRWQATSVGDIKTWDYNGTNIFNTNTGNVGIGINIPAVRLHINETINGAGAQQRISNSSFAINSSSALAFTNSVPAQGYMIGIDNTSGIFKISNSSANINAFNRLQIDLLGNVGIGNFVGVLSRLDVDGQITMRTGATAGYVPMSNANGTMTWTSPNAIGPWTKSGTDIYQTVLTDNVGIGTTTPTEALVVGDDLGNFYSTYTAAVIGNTGGGGALVLGNSTNVMRLDQGTAGSRLFAPDPLQISAPNVGIGTTTPVNRLDIEGGVAIGAAYSGTNTAPTNGLIIEGNVGIGIAVPTEELEVGGGSSNTIRVASVNPSTSILSSAFSSLELSSQQGFNAAIEWRFSVAQGGLSIVGQQTTSNDLVISNTNGSEYVFSQTSLNPFADNQNALGTSGFRWTSLWATDGTINTSDKRLKSNITVLDYGLTDVLKLNPVSFNWIDKPDEEKKLGLIAQEVMEVIPEVIENKEDPDGYLGLSYSELVPVTIKAIQEQQKIINRQNQLIQSLEDRIQILENK